MLFSWINFSLVVGLLFLFTYKKVNAFFNQSRQDLMSRIQAAGEKLEKVQADYEAARKLISRLKEEQEEVRASFRKALEVEKSRIEDDTAKSMSKMVADAELRSKSDAEKSRRILQNELVQQSLDLARETLSREMPAHDASWSANLISKHQSEPSRRKNYAS